MTEVTLEFDNALIGAVYDKFGESTKMVRLNDNICTAKIILQVSPTFWGWIFQFAGRMKILSPNELADDYIQRARLIRGE